MAKKTKTIHTYTIKLLGPGYEYLMGKVPNRVWRYIETECGGNANVYMEKWSDNVLPEDMRLWRDMPWDLFVQDWQGAEDFLLVEPSFKRGLPLLCPPCKVRWPMDGAGGQGLAIRSVKVNSEIVQDQL